MAILLAPSSCTQSPSFLQDVGGEPPPNAATPPGERPVITSDSGPQGVWHCKEYIVDHPDQYKLEEVPEDCRAYILPNAQDAINHNRKVEVPQRIIPVIDRPAENSPQIIIPENNQIEILRSGVDIDIEGMKTDTFP